MEILQRILSDPLTYGILLLAWIGKRYVEARIDKGVDSRFATRLEDHKQALAVLTEQTRFDLQRRLADFGQFAAKKHEAASHVWSAARIAHGHVTGLFGVSSQLTFEEFNVEDMRGHLGELGVPRGKQEEVLADWDTNRKGAVARLRPYLAMLRHQEAERKLFEAQNQAYLNELYFPDNVIEALNGLYKELLDWLLHRKHPELRDEWKPDQARASKKLEAAHEILRSYVGAGAADLSELASGVEGAARRSLPQRPNDR